MFSLKMISCPVFDNHLRCRSLQRRRRSPGYVLPLTTAFTVASVTLSFLFVAAFFQDCPSPCPRRIAGSCLGFFRLLFGNSAADTVVTCIEHLLLRSVPLGGPRRVGSQGCCSVLQVLLIFYPVVDGQRFSSESQGIVGIYT